MEICCAIGCSCLKGLELVSAISLLIVNAVEHNDWKSADRTGPYETKHEVETKHGNETKHEVGSILSMSLISNLMNIPASGLRLGGHKVLICVCGGVIDQTGPYVLSCRRSAGPSQGIRLPL